MSREFLGEHKIIHLSTAAMRDRLNGNWASDVIHMAEYQDCVFIIDQTSGVGAGEVSIQRCDDVTPTSTAGAPSWRYRSSTTPDTWGAWAAISTSSGFVMAITPDKTYELHIRADEVGGTSGWEYLRLNVDEVTNSPIDVDMIAILFNPRYGEDVDAVSSIT